MKINIFFDFKDGAWGGGNQFLKALRNEFISNDVYENDPFNADIIIINSHHFLLKSSLKTILALKKKGKRFVHRIDGPISMVRGINDGTDSLISIFNALFCDATVFQSEWSRNECYKKKIKQKKYETSIINAPDPKIFYHDTYEKKVDQKIKIIATSWSSNLQKGFKIYNYLDENLDFNKYEFSFVGNTTLKFKNINHMKPVDSVNLAKLLRTHDIYITASKNDPCSNALIEALHCGLPAVVLNSGGHTEIIGKGGEIFNKEIDVIAAIDKVAENLEKYRRLISVPTINNVADQYKYFCQTVLKDLKRGKKSNLIYMLSYYFLRSLIISNKINKYIVNIINSIKEIYTKNNIKNIRTNKI